MSTYLLTGDCVEHLRTFPDASIDAVVTDPPYGLSKQPDMSEVLRHWLAEELRAHVLRTFPGQDAIAAALFPADDYQHRGGGFMGKSWDSFVPGPAVWREVLRVLKPGGHAVVFSGTRTYDLTVLAMRIAGFEIRDQLAWMYGTGFPKSLDVAKAVADTTGTPKTESPHPTNACPGGQWCHCGERDERAQSGATKHPPEYTYPDGSAPIGWQGWGTALKPAQEPICLARKPLAGTVAANVLEYGTGGLNVDGCRIGTEPREAIGRWPANVLFDEAAAAMLGEPSRFFYVAKASKAERERGLEHLPPRAPTEVTGRALDSAGQKHARAGMTGNRGRRNHHPTVKPIELMRWLVRLITPPGGFVLDPFAGSGTTGIAAKLEGVRFVGIDLDAEYVEIAKARIDAAT